MEHLLTLIAELSVALAGFTAVISVLDQGRSGDSRAMALQVLRVKQMLPAAAITLFAFSRIQFARAAIKQFAAARSKSAAGNAD